MTREKMPYRRLGDAGVKVSGLSLGGWTTFGSSVTDEATTEAILRRAFDAGVNFFDIADVYAKGEAERQMGRVLRQLPRRDLVISSKVYWPMSDGVNDRGLSRKHIIESVEGSLKRVGTDYLDLYFCHRFCRHHRRFLHRRRCPLRHATARGRGLRSSRRRSCTRPAAGAP